MRRTTLILIIVLVVVILGGGAYLWMKKDTIQWPWISNTATNTTANNSNTVTHAQPTNTTLVNASLPTEVKGDTEVSGKLAIGTIDLTISSQQKYASFNGDTAAKDQTILVVYFDQVQGSTVAAVDQGLRSAAVIDGKTSYPVQVIKIANTAVKGDRGYLQFFVPAKSANLKLQLGSGTSLQSIPLK